MAKANVEKFYDKLAQDAALAEKLNALDKDFAEKNGASADDAAMRERQWRLLLFHWQRKQVCHLLLRN